MDKQNKFLVDMIQAGLHANGWARFRVISNSMQPLIRKDDWVQAAGLSFEDDLHFGDIVLFRRNGEIIMHRVIRIRTRLVTTKGDRCLCADAPVLRADVLARVTRLERGSRILNLQSRWWKIMNFKMAIVSHLVAVSFSGYRKVSQKLLENV